MASRVIYPPTLDSYMPAFVAKEGAICRVYFSLSKFNSRSDFTSVHVSIIKQGSGASVVKKIDSMPRYRATGIILNVKPINAGNNLYYIDINSEDIQDGWTMGWIYKIQIRLSSVDYDGSIKQPAWLNANASNFSEWSSVCTIKAIGNNIITIPNFNYNSLEVNENVNIALSLSTLSVTGKYENTDITEMLYSYKIKLSKVNNEVLEETDILYPNQYINSNQFSYNFHTELEEGDYIFELEYETNNKYKGTETIGFSILFFNLKEIPAKLISAETGANSTVYAEEEEGRIGLQLYSDDKDTLYGGNICLRRASAADDYAIWEDIKIITINYKNINDIDMIYDYTAISGISYLYAIQTIDEYGNRGKLQKINEPIKREYQFSYLMGENEQQLKLKFDNTISNFKTAISDTKTDTIGGKYPFINRNGNMKYKTFSLNGLITYNMDEAHLFLSKDFMGRNPEGHYDFTYEREFRQKVLDFLQTDKPLLFKSPTEGNILVRLMDVQATPNQTVGRMIYSFSANANEIGEPTLANYQLYNLTSLGEIDVNYNVYGEQDKVGQYHNYNYVLGTNIIDLINETYTRKTSDTKQDKVIKISDVTITVEGNPLSIGGWKFKVNDNEILLRYPTNVFTPDIDFTIYDELLIQPGDVSDPTSLHIIVDFKYTVEQSYIKDKAITAMNYEKVVGQLFDAYAPNTSLYDVLKAKYSVEWNSRFRYVQKVLSLVIEADKGTEFLIDFVDGATSNITIGDTNTFIIQNAENISNITYISEALRNADILLDYNCYIAVGAYREE